MTLRIQNGQDTEFVAPWGKKSENGKSEQNSTKLKNKQPQIQTTKRQMARNMGPKGAIHSGQGPQLNLNQTAKVKK